MALSKTYTPADIEDKWYRYWQEGGYFHAEADSPKPKYSVVIPPPNVTGVLHMGHMLNNSIQDILVRRARMQGYEAVWVPGTDHASIATEAKVVAMLRERGIFKKDLSRDEFLKYAWEWKEKYGGIILEQLKKLGASCDWERTRFTMEPKLSEAVIDVFIDLYNKGLIYRGNRMINWDPAGKTAVSDEEVIYKEVQSKLWYFRYPLAEGSGYISIATTRPETMLGDTAICVNPADERYKHLIGLSAVIPVVGRKIPIIADEYANPEFGTGALKVTPAHDPNDYMLGEKHGLEFMNVMEDDGTMSAHTGQFAGLDRYVARKRLVAAIEESGLLEKIEEITNTVGYSERTDAVIEPRISLQWFVDMRKFLEMKPQVLQAVMDDEIRFYPEKYKNTYRHWMENIRDWCISRQLWWGQRIPAWYNENGDFVVCKTEQEAKRLFAEQHQAVDNLHQDEDVLDTWFSSWLWPISVFDGFEDPENPNIKAFYPTNDLVTAPEIIFFWVARMIMAGYMYRDEKPFKNVYFTGIVRDKLRRKMSKSLGNSPDPLDLIAQFGADAVRMGMLLSSPAGNDILYDEAQVVQGRNFCNKLWNALRLVDGWEIAGEELPVPDYAPPAIDWFAHKLNAATAEINEKLNQYRISEALMSVYKLAWDDFCSAYLEMIKPEFGTPVHPLVYRKTVNYFTELMKLLHPFMPFISEEIFHHLHHGKPDTPLIVARYPEAKAGIEEVSDLAVEVTAAVRQFRNQKGLSPKLWLSITLLPENEKQRTYLKRYATLMSKMANAHVHLTDSKESGKGVPAMADTCMIFIENPEASESAADIDKLKAELEYHRGFLLSVNAKLSNEKFVANAKPDLVERERQKKADAESKIQSLEAAISSLS